MHHLIILVLISMISHTIHGQGGIITYNKKMNWANIVTKMPYLSLEEKERIMFTWGKDDGENKGTNYSLTYNQTGSVYKMNEQEENLGYSWNEDEDVFIRNYETRTTSDLREMLGKLYLIEGEIPRIKWKILNELKDVAGYVCMKAETKDTVNNIVITAWFTDKLPVGAGPEGMGGLPGMILALDYNTDDILIVATKIELKEVTPVLPVPKKIKGKKSNYEEYNSKKKKHILLSIAGKRNPYWDLRY